MPGAALGALAAAEDALARLDERIRASSIAEGFVNRTHFQDACASLWLIGELVSLEDLVLHDARMDIHAPTHALTRAQMVLRARRRIAGAPPDWALSPDGLMALRGDGDGGTREAVRAGEGDSPEDDEAPGSPGDAGLLAGELAAIDHVLNRGTKILAGGAIRAELVRNPLIYDLDREEGERLEAWRRAAAEAQSDSPVLAAALLWDAWETEPPLDRQAWLGPLLVSAVLRERQKTRAHLACVNFALRCVPREKRRSPDQAMRLAAFLEAITGGAEAGMKDHDRWLLKRKQLEAHGPPLQLEAARFGGIDAGAADRLRRHDRRLARGDAARRANHGRRARPPRDDRARPLSRLGNLVTIFCASPGRPGPTAPGHRSPRSWRRADHPRTSSCRPSRLGEKQLTPPCINARARR